MVDNLTRDLFSKAPGTIAFDSMLKHFVDSYHIEQLTDISVIENSMIEYFYFLLIQEHSDFRQRAHIQYPQAINIEYADFSNMETLIHKLAHLEIFDLQHFIGEYARLQSRNIRYLNRKTQFASQVTRDQLDIITTAYAGALVHKNMHVDLDWYNQELRDKIIGQYFDDIKNWCSGI